MSGTLTLKLSTKHGPGVRALVNLFGSLSERTMARFYNKLANLDIEGITFNGNSFEDGEQLIQTLEIIKTVYKLTTIVITSYTQEQLLADVLQKGQLRRLTEACDVLVTRRADGEGKRYHFFSTRYQITDFQKPKSRKATW